MTALAELRTPCLLLDRAAFDHNVATMSAERPADRLRPHVKAFKSTALARRLAVVPQDVSIPFPFLAGEVVLMGRSPHVGSAVFDRREDVEAARAAMEKEPDVPEDFELPDDVPAYPGATVTNVGVNDGDKLAVTFSSDGGAEDVAQYYFEELRHGDWSVDQTDAPDGVALFAEKGSRSMTVMVEKRPEGARISILSMSLDLALP